MKNVMTFTKVGKSGYGKNYSDLELENYFKAQIDNSLYYGWDVNDIIIATNFDFEFRGVKSILINDVCNYNKYFNKFYAILELLKNNKINDNFWFHDLDSWQINKFDFPDMEEDFGVCSYLGNNNWNTAVMFLKPGCVDLIEYFVNHMKQTYSSIKISDHVSDENVINQYSSELINMGCDRFKVLSNSYNIGWTFFDERYNNAKDNGCFNIIGVKPNSIREYEKFKTYDLIPKHLDDIFSNYGFFENINISRKLVDSIPDKSEYKNTTSKKFKFDLIDYFEMNNISSSLLEVGSNHGHTTHILCPIFKKITAIDIREENHNFSKDLNKYFNNIEYLIKDVYSTSWDEFKDKFDVVFIDCVHEYDYVKSDINNALNINSKILVFDDYGLSPGVKSAVDEFINNGLLILEKNIGIEKGNKSENTFHKIFKDSEGVICKNVRAK